MRGHWVMGRCRVGAWHGWWVCLVGVPSPTVFGMAVGRSFSVLPLPRCPGCGAALLRRSRAASTLPPPLPFPPSRVVVLRKTTRLEYERNRSSLSETELRNRVWKWWGGKILGSHSSLNSVPFPFYSCPSLDPIMRICCRDMTDRQKALIPLQTSSSECPERMF